ncbi:MAG: 50S ribosomal protein L7/L12 [Planctomycetia bacterium]|nr:50S ribosomal protein L7/L12 [Planctomycetia bacterium]
MEISAEIQKLGDAIANLKLTEAVALKEYLKEKYKLEPAAGGAVMVAAAPGGGGGAAAPEKPAEKTEFTVVLDGVADATKKISVIKVVREITGVGLADGKKMVDEAPKTIKENVAKDEAEAIKKKIEDAGGKVTLK